MSTSQGPHSWSKEFKKRRHAFEQPSRVGPEGGSASPSPGFEEEGVSEAQTGPREGVGAQDCSGEVPLRRINSPSTPTAPKPRSMTSWSPASGPHPLSPSLSSRSGQPRRHSSEIDGQREAESEDDDSLAPLGIGSGVANRRSRSTMANSSAQRVLAIGEETGQKERMIPYGETTSPGFSSQSQSDDSEREDGALTHQIALLTVKNNSLQKQLNERELERDRLREQLELQRQERNSRTPYSPTGLPSRLLDGRKVLRDSISGLATGSGGPTPVSPSPSAHSPTTHSPRFRTPPGGASGGTVDPGRKGFLDTFAAELMASAERVQMENSLKRKNADLERHLREVTEEKKYLEHELQKQKEAFAKMQVREQDLSKDIEILRDENSHHTGAINKLKTERDGLQTENDTLHEELHAVTEKLNKIEKCYKEVEHENVSLDAEIDQLMSDKKQLFEEKQNLQTAVEDALKTKENYRSTIKQLREQNRVLEEQTPGVRKPVAPKPDKRRGPETKVQQTLGEVMTLREEKTELQGKILSAQKEIDSLKADLQAQETQEHTLDDFCGEVTAHLLEFQDRMVMMNKDLATTKTTVSTLLGQQKTLVHDSFMLLAEKCKEQLSTAQVDRSKAETALKASQKSLQAMESDYQTLKSENTKLQAKRSTITSDVSKLRSEIAALQDQKRLLSVQLSQHETLAREKDERMTELETQHKQLQDKLTSSEKRWKNEYVRLERDWEGKLAEANLTEELLSEEKESLLNQQAALEQKLDQLQLENKQLTIAKTELEAQVGNWEAKIKHLTSQVDENDSQISSAQQEVARLLAERAVITAKMTFTQQSYEERFQALQCEHSSAMESASLQSKELQESLDSMKAERAKLSDQFALVSEKETQIDRLTSQMAILTQEKEQMKVEMGLLNEKYSSAQQQFQSLAEAEQTRLLNNEKLKLTLKTEIELLKSRLNSVNDEKHKLEDKMLKLMAEKADSTSAFQAVPQSKQVEQLKKQIAALQVESKQHRKFNQQESSNRVQLVDLQTRLASLEVENKRLREAARNSTDAIDATASLRKQVSEMSRKTFFLESEKKSLTEKVHSMQTSLKVARDTKDRMATDQVLKLQEQNQALQERIRNLERMLTTKWMAAEQKIVSTVEENDKLRQRLLQVQETITSHQQQGTIFTSLIESLKSESELLSRMKENLESSRAEFEQLETKQERVQALQTEIQQLLSSSGGRSTTPTPRVGGGGGGGVSSTNSLPPVLKSLPPGYLSSLQGSKRSASPSDSSRPLSPSSSVVQEKLTQMQTVSCEFGDGLEKHQKTLKEQESELEQLKERFAAIEERLTEASSKSSEVDHLDPKASVEGIELRPDQVQTIAILQKQNETLQDQVIDRDVALQDIELQMKKDYEMHDRKFALLKSQVLELREQLSDKDNQLRAKDQYIQQTEERCLEAQNQLFKAHKEMERVLKEREQLVTKGIPENLQLQGITSVADALRVQGEELCQLQKALNEFTFDVTQLQSQLDSVHREKSVLQSKQIEMERMHIQMKEAMSADIGYLRKLNLQLVEQHMKAEKATEILREVKGAQEAFRKQKDLQKLETELESCNLKLHEQSRTISDFERQVASQALTIKLLQAGKQHSVLMTQHTKELTNQIGPRPAGYLRPRSAESARRPNYRISDFKSRTNIAASVLQEGEFSIPFPVQNSSVGPRVDILNLEEQPEDSGANLMLSLGPMVVTDDEYSSTLHEEKASKPQRVQKLRNRGHRRTASTGSNVLPYVKEKETVPMQHATTLPHSHPHSSSSKQKPIPKYPKRPGSAGSTRTDVDVSHDQAPEMKSPDQIVQSAQVVSEYMNALNNDLSKEGKSQQQLHPQQQHQQQQQQGSKESTEKSGKDQKPSSGMRSGRAFSQGASNFAMKIKHKYSEIRSKQANKSTDSNETTSSHEGGSGTTSSAAKSDSNLDKQSKSSSKESTAESANTATAPPQSGKVNSNQSDVSNLKPEKLAAKDLNRTESMSSTCSTLSLFSHLPSRNPSFSVYDGGESSPYSHESLEIGDSVENLQAFTKLGYNPYLMPIHLHHNSKHDTTTSSSDEDMSHHDYGRLGRRKRSSGATNTDQSHDTPRHKDASDNSNSSCDSDQLQRSDPNYHGKSEVHQRGGIPVHRNESISISDMEKYATDVEIDQKAVDLQQRFGRVRYSSTGSVKICYSESSNTSMEDVSKN